MNHLWLLCIRIIIHWNPFLNILIKRIVNIICCLFLRFEWFIISRGSRIIRLCVFDLFILHHLIRTIICLRNMLSVSILSLIQSAILIYLSFRPLNSFLFSFLRIDRSTSDELNDWFHKPNLVALNLHENASKKTT